MISVQFRNLLSAAEAHETLKACHEKRQGLVIMVDETSERIRTKRRQLEEIREELRELGGWSGWVWPTTLAAAASGVSRFRRDCVSFRV